MSHPTCFDQTRQAAIDQCDEHFRRAGLHQAFGLGEIDEHSSGFQNAFLEGPARLIQVGAVVVTLQEFVGLRVLLDEGAHARPVLVELLPRGGIHREVGENQLAEVALPALIQRVDEGLFAVELTIDGTGADAGLLRH